MGKYKRIKLPDGTTRDEHRLIVEDYLGYKLDRDIVVHHIDDDPTNNDLENLDICLLSVHARYHITEETIENLMCGGGIGNRVRGSSNATAKLTEEDILIIRERIESGDSLRGIARDYGVHYTSIRQIKTGKSWSHIP